MSQRSVPVAPSRAPSRRRLATRERVLDAARDVFAERGVFGGTVEDICARAGFTRGAFYSNFADKDDVLRALIDREHERLLAYLDTELDLLDDRPAGAADAGLEATMASVAGRLLRSVPADRQLSLMLQELEIHAVRDPAVARVFVDADARFRARIADLVDRGLRRLGRELVVPLDDATDAVIAVVERGTRRALLRGPGGDPDELAMTILPLLVMALSQPRRDPGSG